MREKTTFTATELRAYFAKRLTETTRALLRAQDQREMFILQGRAQVWFELDNLPVTLALFDEEEREQDRAKLA